MAPDIKELHWVKPPRQERSQQTLERIIDAAEGLILEQGLENTTIKDVARRAESSVGAFYARFADKEALLRTVFDRFCEQAEATIDMALAPEQWKDTPFDQLMATGVAFLIRVFRERGKLLSAFSVRAAADPALSSVGQRLAIRLCVRIGELLAARDEQLTHPDPDVAIRTFVWLVLSALEARALYNFDDNDPAALDERQLNQELTRIGLAYLAISPTTGSRS